MLLKPELVARLLADSAGSVPATMPELTGREGEVLAAVARGERSKEIAVHLASIYNKLGVDSRAAAIAVAAQRGLFAAGKDNT